MIFTDKEKEIIEIFEYIMGDSFYVEFNDFTATDFISLLRANYQHQVNKAYENIRFIEEQRKDISGCPF